MKEKFLNFLYFYVPIEAASKALSIVYSQRIIGEYRETGSFLFANFDGLIYLMALLGAAGNLVIGIWLLIQFKSKGQGLVWLLFGAVSGLIAILIFFVVEYFFKQEEFTEKSK